MFSRQIFAKSGRFREIPCVFPYDQGILHVSGRELIRGKPPQGPIVPGKGQDRKLRIMHASCACLN